ncbi:MAG: L-aspartate oxidase [Gemmataceae bacterium]|nr:L-aspartate oxidase [Gemmataceae bacterium]
MPPQLEVLVVTKDSIQQSNSTYAQGGIATVLSPEDAFENHIEDTLTAGGGLCDRAVVEMVVREAPRQIDDLIRWGTKFDEEGGQLALTREGGHSHRRIVHALGDSTGYEVMRAIIERARQTANVTLWDNTFTIDLLTHEGRCAGVMVSRSPSPQPLSPQGRGALSSPLAPGGRGAGGEGERLLVWARQTILASGGSGMVYRETTNPPVATGDGMAAAYRAGAELRDMEFMQFHPTVLYVAGSSRYLISEAVRGEGAYLRDKDGVRFMPSVDSRAELAPRDVVAQAIFRRMEQTRHPNVYLDLSHLDPALVRRRFPGIDRVCRSFGLDITRDLIPIRPGAHYMVGGVTVDMAGRTTLPGLWAAGEVTSSGLHGANRLASNSLLEGLVYGALCGRGAAEEAARMPDTLTALPVHSTFEPDRDAALDVTDITNSLRSLMVRAMGVVRDRAGLEQARRDVAFWCRYVHAHEFDDRAGWELQNLLTIARLMIDSALRREESRGVHSRSDFPQRDDAHWQRHLVCPSVGELFGGVR